MCSLVVAACGVSLVAEGSVRLSVFPDGSGLGALATAVRYCSVFCSGHCSALLRSNSGRCGSSGSLDALVGQQVSDFGYGFVSPGRFSVSDMSSL
ncbi:hypothetical protein DY000_02003291 [Brassica cretica]|uniref:Secreted protein n=1 Tax=Brassica cretica TaxID=69181 RepID=A0ABQ7CGH6_BRACR|nr:hypothetical protein DY000_02003291 [Brassica cretica]